MIKLYTTYKEYEKLMNLGVPVREMLRLHTIIKTAIATLEGQNCFESLAV